MANSKFEYTRTFESPDSLLPSTYIVIRIDGRGFHKLSAKYAWTKPNDRRAIDLSNAAAAAVMREIHDIVVAYGQSDEYSFVFPPSSTLFDRRASKLMTTVVSTYTAYYTHLWPTFFPTVPLTPPLPTFDGRAVVYPAVRHIRDYLSWRQADCHINNLYNTTFHALVQLDGQTPQEAEAALAGTFSNDKNELLFSRFGINYNNEDAIWRKGSVVYRDFRDKSKDVGVEARVDVGGDREMESKENGQTDEVDAETVGLTESQTPQPHSHPQPRPQPQPSTALPRNTNASTKSSTTTQPGQPLSKTQLAKQRKRHAKAVITVEHVDIIKDAFWEERPWILGDTA